MISWSPWALPGLVAGVLTIALTAFVWRTARNPLIRRRIVLLLAAESVIALTGIFGPLSLLGDQQWFALGWRIHLLNDCFLLAVYLPAVASVVHSPLVRPFGEGWVRHALTGLAALYAVGVVFAPPEWVSTVGKNFPGYGIQWAPVPGPIAALIFATLFCSFMLGLVATFTQWRKSSPGLAKRRAGALAIAFGVRDATVGGMYITIAVTVALGINLLTPEMEVLTMVAIFMGYGGATVYVMLMAYAIAIYNVIEIDLQIKRGIKQSTIAAAFVAIFFIVSEASAEVLSDTIGTVTAIIASGLLLFFLAPLQELAGRFANRAMPGVDDTPEYRHFRRLQIYGEAVQHTMSDNEINAVGRISLNRLREELDLSEEDASSFEVELGLHAASHS